MGTQPDRRVQILIVESGEEIQMQGTGKILFINGSPNKEGNTAALAEALLSEKEYETLNLTI